MILPTSCRYYEGSHERFLPGDPSKRAFTYFVLTGGRFIYASAIRLAVLKFLLSMTVRPAASGSLHPVTATAPAELSVWPAGSQVLKHRHAVQATADVLAMASLEVDISKIEVGQTITVKWRGKPVFIRHRSEEEITTANNVKLKELRDPQSDEERVTNPEVLGSTIVGGSACYVWPDAVLRRGPLAKHRSGSCANYHVACLSA